MYHWIPLADSSDLSQLENHVSSEFDPKHVAKKLADGISTAVKAVLIESKYNDKDYRSTYYSYYAKKGQRYRPDCVRLHFFDEEVTYDNKTLSLHYAGTRLDDHYFGYMVLRPTGIATIGRTVLSPDVRKDASRYIITAGHKVHLLGFKLSIQGFPSMDQHVDISVCAHAACWSILRHYSERYGVYREYLTHDITMMAHEFNPGGIVPSMGLEIAHAERVFQEAGTFPVHTARKVLGKKDHSFYRQLFAYVDSGFLRYTWDEVKSLAVVDDNHLPYLSIPTSQGSPYAADDIDAFIVALPEKMFYPADAVDRVSAELFSLPVKGLPSKDETIIRYFVTTGSALRHFVRSKESEFDPKLLTKIMELPFAQFVWVVEFATRGQFAAGQVAGRAVIDATAGLLETFPLWLIHSSKEALIFDRMVVGSVAGMGALSLAATGHAGFTRMDQNLRPTRTK